MQEQQPPPAPPPAPPLQAQTTGPKPRGRRKKIRTEPIRPICPQCEKQFSNQSALTKHKLTHSDERKFACQQCSKAFKRHDHLTGHMQTHSNRKPYNCTIQGCDKTYCDARSLRRHKENIHHIVTPREQNGNNTSGSNHIGTGPTGCGDGHLIVSNTNRQSALNNGPLNNQTSFNKSVGDDDAGHGGQDTDLNNNNSNGIIAIEHNQTPDMNHLSPNTTFHTTTATSTEHQIADGSLIYLTNLNNVHQHSNSSSHNHHHHNHHQPSHLLRRRIQRLHSDSGTYGCNNDTNNQDLLGGRGYLVCSTTSTSSTHNLPPQNLQHGNNNNNHYLSNQHASFSADYASTQHFNFDFSNMNNGHMDHAISSSSSIPLSAGSITDSGLGLNSQYEQRTPNHHPQEQQAPTLQAPQPLHPNQQQQEQQQQQQQPLQHQHQHYQQQHHHHQPHTHPHPHQQLHHVSYSAGYATTQHFDFDFSSTNPQTINGAPVVASCAKIETDANNNLVDQQQQQQQQASNNQNYCKTNGNALMETQNSEMISESIVVDRKHNIDINLSPSTPTTFQTSTMSSTATSTDHLIEGSTVYLTDLNNVQQPPQPQPRPQSQQQPHPPQPPPQHQQQPSHLLRRRIQRLHSDSGIYGCSNASTNNNDNQDLLNGRGYLACSTTTSTTSNSSSSTHNLQPQTLQHGNNHNNNNNYLSSNQHASFSADYASTQHFNFDFANMNNSHMDHSISSSNVPLSSGSITDSGLSLNAQYEQRVTNNSHELSHQHHQHHQAPLHQHYHQPHHVSYTAG